MRNQSSDRYRLHLGSWQEIEKWRDVRAHFLESGTRYPQVGGNAGRLILSRLANPTGPDGQPKEALEIARLYTNDAEQAERDKAFNTMLTQIPGVNVLGSNIEGGIMKNYVVLVSAAIGRTQIIFNRVFIPDRPDSELLIPNVTYSMNSSNTQPLPLPDNF